MMKSQLVFKSKIRKFIASDEAFLFLGKFYSKEIINGYTLGVPDCTYVSDIWI